MGSLPLLIVWAMFAVPRPVEVTVRPSFALQPGSFLVRAMIEKHDDNRLLILKAVLHETFDVRVTRFQIDGAQRQRIFTPANKCICWFDLPAGEYTAIAELTRVHSGEMKIYRSQQPFRVIGMEP